MRHSRVRSIFAVALCFAVGVFCLSTTVAGAEDPTPQGTFTVSGVVRSNNVAIPNARVQVDAGVIVRANNAGFYTVGVAAGNHNFTARGPCKEPDTEARNVQSNITLNFELDVQNIIDSFGYQCRKSASAYIDATTVLGGLTGADDSSVQVNLPFTFTFYGSNKTSAFVSSNGHINFAAANNDFTNSAIPSAGAPNDAIYAFWDDLFVDGGATVRTRTTGSSPNRKFTIEWRNVRIFGSQLRIDFQIQLNEDDRIFILYRNIDPAQPLEQGSEATIGIENAAGTVALQYSFNFPLIDNNLVVNYKTNLAPTANAGPDKTVSDEDPFNLNASGSTDPEGGLGALQIFWAQISGPPTNIQNPNNVQTQVTGHGSSESLTYRVTVTDPFGRQDTDDIVVTTTK